MLDQELTLTIGTDTRSGRRRGACSGRSLTPDSALEKQATSVSAKLLLPTASTATCSTISRPRQCNCIIVHAFVTSRIDYGNSLFTAAPKIWTDNLQRVMNAAARVISDTRKLDQGLQRFLHEDLHWLDVPQHVTYKLLVFKCLHGLAPRYLAELCVPVADVTPRRKLRSATRGLLDFLRYNMN